MHLVKKYWLGLVLLLLVAAAGGMIYTKLHPKRLPPNLIEGSGRIDGDLVRLNAKYPGRLSAIYVDEGVPVHRGMVVARLESREYEAQRAGIVREIMAKKEALKAKEVALAIAKETTPQLLKRAEAGVRTRRQQREELQKRIASQKALLAQDRRDLKRLERLYAQRLIPKERLEKGRLKVQIERDTLEALLRRRAQMDEAVDIARSEEKDAAAAQKRIAALEADLAAFRAGVAALEASRARIDALLSEMTLRSPLDGFTVEKVAYAGEVVGAGMPVATLIDPSTLYLKIFVDTLQNGRIKLHDKAEIFLDAWPDHPIPAEVVRIAQQAEFTPKEVSVRSDRIQRVFAVHLKPLKVDPLLKLGIPAIGVVSLDGKGLPASLHEIPPL